MESVFIDISNISYNIEINGNLNEDSYSNIISKNRIKSISIGTGVTSIDVGSFKDAQNLKSVTFAQEPIIHYIGDNAFRNANQLTDIIIPASVNQLGNNIFQFDTSLTNVSFATGTQMAYIGAWMFDGATSLKDFVIPDSVTKIKGYAFRGNTSLTEITIPSSVTTIDTDAFKSSSLNTVYINVEHMSTLLSLGPNQTIGGKENVDIIGRKTFNGENNVLTQTIVQSDLSGASIVTINGYNTIGPSAFDNQSTLTDLTISPNLTNIETSAFNGCENLTNVTLWEITLIWLNKLNIDLNLTDGVSQPFFGATNVSINVIYMEEAMGEFKVPDYVYPPTVIDIPWIRILNPNQYQVNRFCLNLRFLIMYIHLP